jgi:hypothetical protein
MVPLNLSVAIVRRNIVALICWEITFGLILRFVTQAGNDIYPCEKCGKQFASKVLMMSHLETHTGNKAEKQEPRLNAILTSLLTAMNFNANFAVRNSHNTRTMIGTRGKHMIMMKTQGICVPCVARASVRADS